MEKKKICINYITQVDSQKYSYTEDRPQITLTYVNGWYCFLFTYLSEMLLSKWINILLYHTTGATPDKA